MSESIYNLIPREEVVQVRTFKKVKAGKHDAPIPGSTFGCRGTTRLPGAGTVVKKQGAIFGPHAHPVPLKTKAGPARDADRGAYSSKRMPSIPKRTDRPVMGIKTNKNFITANAVEAILQVPKSLDSKDLNYLEKEDYGKVPEYLDQVKEEIKRENEMIDKYVKEQMGIEDEYVEEFEEMDELDRKDLIQQLKKKWDDVNAKYQKMTHLVVLDTAGQVRRKESLEKALAEIEADINRLSKPGPVLLRK
jgi:hypothetical protein